MKFKCICLLILMKLLSGCASQQTIDVEQQSLLSAEREIPDEQLLDVGIVVFEPIQQAEDELNLPEVRGAEARFIPVHLRNTLQQSSNWGAVRVIPETVETLDLIINGTVLESDGEALSLHIIARDATGNIWLDTIYTDDLTSTTAYQSHSRGKKDAFQDVYNAIANDLLQIRNQKSNQQIKNIHRIALLLFAQKLAPDAFSSYVIKDKNQLLQAIHMPADNDPMYIRVQKIRAREAMLIDTFDSYYDHFYNEMWDSYAAWRNNHREEMIVYREIQKKAYIRYALGAVAIAGAVALAAAGVDGTGLIQAAMIGAGGYAIKTGYDKTQEAQINVDAIKELDQSFDREVKSQVVDINGKTIELTGSAQAQFQSWRKMMHDLYVMETGFDSPQATPQVDELIVQPANPNN